MKKIYFLGACALSSSLGMAQFSQSMVASKTISTNTAVHSSLNQDRAPGDVIGSVMNFSVPADWTINNSGTSGGGWVIGTAAPDGPFSGGMGVIESTSGGNFALFDADGTTGEGIITMANPINLSTYANVAFEFESYYRNFQGDAFLEISTNGTTWTTYQVHALLPLNESTANPEVVSINISGVAANQATVWARFRYDSADDYAWMVDDAKFVEGYSDNLILNQAFMASGSEALDYYIVPTSQIAPVTFGAYIANNGTNNQTNTVLTAVVNDGTSDVYNQSSTGVTIPAFGDDSLGVTVGWTPTAGSFDVTLSTSSDQTEQSPADNEILLETITVGGIVYARDNGIPTGSVGYLGSTPVPTSMGNYFEFHGDYLIGKIQVGVSASSVEGEPIYAEIRKWDGTDFVFVGQTSDHQLTAADLGNIITLTLDSPELAVDGDIYYVGAAHYGGDARFLTAQIAEGAVIFNDGAASQQNSVFIVRLEEVFASVEEQGSLEAFGAYPNPASANLTVNYSLNESASVSYAILDVAGNAVISDTFGNQNQGNYTHTLDVSTLANGVYYYTLSVNGVVTTHKLTIMNN